MLDAKGNTLVLAVEKLTTMRTINKIITKVNCKYGAPMGRNNVGDFESLPFRTRVYDCRIPMSNGAYDKGGAYWGIGKSVRVRYTKDLSYIEFYHEK